MYPIQEKTKNDRSPEKSYSVQKQTSGTTFDSMIVTPSQASPKKADSPASNLTYDRRADMDMKTYDTNRLLDDIYEYQQWNRYVIFKAISGVHFLVFYQSYRGYTFGIIC